MRMVQTCSGAAEVDAFTVHVAALMRSYCGTEVAPAAVQLWAGDADQYAQPPLEHSAADGQHPNPGTDSHRPAETSETYMVSGYNDVLLAAQNDKSCIALSSLNKAQAGRVCCSDCDIPRALN